MSYPIFHINKEDIKQLDDSQARELVARLCQVEVQAKRISTSCVLWGGNQRAADGGVDVRVSNVSGINLDGYIPKNQTIYQVKAEKFGPAKIPKEMAPKSVLHASIRELESYSGAYIIVSTRDDVSDSALKNRKKTMRDCLATFDISDEQVHIDFYDCQKVASWAEKYPEIVIWLQRLLDKALQGWQPYGAWAYKEETLDTAYILDEKARVIAPDNHADLTTLGAIEQLRGELQKKVSVRLVGLSGVGKTRLVQALFDESIDTGNAALAQDKVIYTDLADSPTPQPLAMLDALISQTADCILIIDNCGSETHQKLTERINASNHNIRLLTIEYDIREDIPENTRCYRLETASTHVIVRLLGDRYPVLSPQDSEKIAQFSDGNARIALALASTSSAQGELARLNDEVLFKRLFQQKNSENEGLLHAAQVASLLYSFDGESTEGGSEIQLLATLSDQTALAFFKNISELLKRGLAQQRGRWRAVLPHAIANRLAAQALDGIPWLMLQASLITNASERVQRSFSRRLGYLHESDQAQKIVTEWLEPTGLLGDLTQLDETQLNLFINIAPVNPSASLQALLRAISAFSTFDSSNMHPYQQVSLVSLARVARSLAYDADLFQEACKVLIGFHKLHSGNDEIKNMLLSLFGLMCSGTQATPEQRIAFIKSLLDKQDDLGLEALQQGFKRAFFSHYSFDFGARKRDYGWQAKNQEDIKEWYDLFIGVAVEYGESSAKVRKALGRAIGALWVIPSTHSEIKQAAHRLVAIDGWPDGWVGIQHALRYSCKRNPSTEQDATAIATLLQPKTLLAEIQTTVLSFGLMDWKLNQNQEKAKTLGEKAAFAPDVFDNLELYFCNRDSGHLYGFAVEVGKADNAVATLLTQIRTFLQMNSNKVQHFRLLGGVIYGWSQTNPQALAKFLDDAMADEVWGKYFPYLQCCVEFDQTACDRLIKCCELQLADENAFFYLNAHKLLNLSGAQIVSVLEPVLRYASAIKLLEIIEVLIGPFNENLSSQRAELQQYCIKLLSALDWSKIDCLQNYHRIEDIISFTLTEKMEDAQFIALSKSILESHCGELLRPLFVSRPELMLNTCFEVSRSNFDGLLSRLRLSYSSSEETALSVLPDEVLIAWCNIAPDDRYPFAAHTCQLFCIESDNSCEEKTTGMSSIALKVFKNCPDKEQTLNIFVKRFSPNGWSGRLSDILQTRYGYLEQFKTIDNTELYPVIEQAEAELLLRIKEEESRENSRERLGTERFE